MIQLNQTEFIKLLKEMGSDIWHTYTVLRIVSSGDTVCLKQSEMAEMLGVSSNKTVYTRLKRLEEISVNGQHLLEHLEKKTDCNIYKIIPLEVSKILQVSKDLPLTYNIYNNNSLKDSKEHVTGNELPTTEKAAKKKKQKEEKHPLSTANGVIKYFCRRYKETYAEEYKPNWSRDTKNLNTWIKTTNLDPEIIQELINVVFRHYDKRWKSNSFLRPTIAQIHSWLGQQALAFAKQNVGTQTNEVNKVSDPIQEAEIKPVDSNDLLDEWTQKGWFD